MRNHSQTVPTGGGVMRLVGATTKRLLQYDAVGRVSGDLKFGSINTSY